MRAALLDAARQHGPFDGFLLALHGAMVAEGEPAADLALVRAVRQVLGPAPVGIATFDLHANLDLRLAQMLDGAFAYETYPHVDAYECGRAAARLLDDALRGGPRPQLVIARRAQLDGCDHGRSSGSLMPQLLAQAQALRAANPALDAVALCAGFPWADVPHAGPAVAVTHRGDEPAAARCAEALADRIWATREQCSLHTLAPAEAVARACEAARGGGRVVVADFSDNPGGGGSGDATALLRAWLEAPAADPPDAAFVHLWDPESVQRLHDAGAGAVVALAVGGRTDAHRGGAPLPLEGRVVHLGAGEFTCSGPVGRGRRLSIGRTATLAVGRTRVVLASRRLQVTDPEHLRACGLDPAMSGVLMLKSLQHFRAAFEPGAAAVIFADSGGLVSRQFASFAYRRVRRPIWPLDPATALQPETHQGPQPT